MKNWIQNNRSITGYYLIWLFINIAIFLISDKSDDYWFYPFCDGKYSGCELLKAYGAGELFVFGFGPAILFAGWFLIKPLNTKNDNIQEN